MTSFRRRARDISIQTIQAALGASFDWWLHIDSDDSKQASWGHRVDSKKGFPRSTLETMHGDAIVYRSVNPVNLWRIRRAINLKPDDVFVDIGCGKGRIVCYMARHKIRKAIGIEFDALLAEAATRNAATLRQPHTPIEIRRGDAALADYTEATSCCSTTHLVPTRCGRRSHRSSGRWRRILAT